MIRSVTCHQSYCPYRKQGGMGCSHPDGKGRVATPKSSVTSVPPNCPVLKRADVLVGAELSPASGELQRIEHIAARVIADVNAWLEQARAVYGGGKR